MLNWDSNPRTKNAELDIISFFVLNLRIPFIEKQIVRNSNATVSHDKNIFDLTTHGFEP